MGVVAPGDLACLEVRSLDLYCAPIKHLVACPTRAISQDWVASLRCGLWGSLQGTQPL